METVGDKYKGHGHMALLHRTQMTLHRRAGWGPDGTAVWYRDYTSQIGRTRPLWRNDTGCGAYGTVIGCGLYKKATEDTDPTAHLHRVGTPWYCHRAGTVAQL